MRSFTQEEVDTLWSNGSIGEKECFNNQCSIRFRSVLDENRYGLTVSDKDVDLDDPVKVENIIREYFLSRKNY